MPPSYERSQRSRKRAGPEGKCGAGHMQREMLALLTCGVKCWRCSGTSWNQPTTCRSTVRMGYSRGRRGHEMPAASEQVVAAECCCEWSR